MPTIRLSDQFGLSVDVTPSITSSLAKYIGNLPNLSVPNFNLKSIAELTLDNPKVTDVKLGLSLLQPVDIGAGNAALKVNAGVNGELKILAPPPTGGKLFDSDLYGEDIPIGPRERYVSIAVSANAGPQVSATSGQLSFGFQAGAAVTLANYRRFETAPVPPRVIDAVRDTLANLCIPGSPDDLRALPSNSVVTLEGTGSVKFSGSVNLLTLANPLATLSFPAPLPTVKLSAGASVSIGASCNIGWDYQLRIRKLDQNRITLGFYRKRDSATTVSVDVQGGISASTKDSELFSAVLSVLSPDATADATTLTKLGLPAAQVAEIQEAVKAAAQRKLEVALQSSLTMATSHDAAFLYQFDLSALDQAGSNALQSALRGDLSGLTAGRPLPAGVQELRSIVTDLHKSGWTWKINLLGIYNYISVSELTRSGKVLFEPVTGDLVITDTATAKRVSASMVNFGADTEKLRHVMAESFLMSVVYRGSQAVVAAPELRCFHSFFEEHAATDRETMRDELDVAAALGLLTNADEQRLVQASTQFGRTLAFAETSYDGNLTPLLFLNGTKPKTLEEYEAAGRQALQLLVHEGDPDAYRLRPAMDNDLWNKMRAAGPVSLGPLFAGFTTLQIQVIAADYTVIVWWAEAMHSCAQRVAAMKAASPDSPKFASMREDLAKHVAGVAKNTKEEFGKPWGLLAMDLVSGRRAAASVRIASSSLAIAVDRPALAAVAS